MTSALWRQTGGVWPVGVSCSLTWYDVGALLTFIRDARIRTIVEIGVEHGGASALFLSLCSYAPELMAYLGIDITLNALATPVRTQDSAVFWQRDAWLPDTVQEVGVWLRERPAPRLIFIDGGNKPKELCLYAPLLAPGDLIVAHDYGNEYSDEALVDLPPALRRLRPDWLDDTLLCAFRAGEA